MLGGEPGDVLKLHPIPKKGGFELVRWQNKTCKGRAEIQYNTSDYAL